ncbi:MAG TPA: hypothetical protein VF550_12135 [Polyangia bacterium]
MRTRDLSKNLLLAAIFCVFVWGCGNSSGGGYSGGATSTQVGSGGSVLGGSGGVSAGSGGANTTAPTASGGAIGRGGALGSGGFKGTGGVQASGGSPSGAGGASAGTGGRGTGGTTAGTGGRGTGGATAGNGGAGTGGEKTDAGGSTEAGATGGDCVIGTWPTADPSTAGPFATVTENEVGPQAGAVPDGGTAPRFTMFRPKDMVQGGLCHPVITWGNGTNVTPAIYKTLLNNLASHGFVVIGSNSTNVAQGNPAPMLVGVTWVLEQNDTASSVLYHRIDTTHIGATGHSQGAMATTQVSADSHITTSVPIEGASAQKNLHGPAMFFCGGQDTLVGCSGAQSAINAVTTLPAMYAEYLSVDHGSWMTFSGSKPSPVETAVTAWMRVHLMGDPGLRSWFYGASCKLCTDSGWQISQKNMDP